MTRVSVLMPACNHGRYIDQALRSALAQTHAELELLVLDDGSTDDTPEVIARHAGDPRLRRLRHERNLGIPRSLNALLAAARGSHIAILNADDAWYPDHLADALANLEASGAAMCWAHCDLVDAGGRPHPQAAALRAQLWGELRPGASLYEALAQRNVIPSHSVVLRREALDAVGRFDERLDLLHDWDLWLRIAADQRVVKAGRAAGLFRWHGANHSAPGRYSREHYGLERAVVHGKQIGWSEGPRRLRAERRYYSALHRLGNRLDGRLRHPGVRAIYAEAARLRPASVELALKRRVAGRRGDSDDAIEALLWRFGFAACDPPQLSICTITRERDQELAGWLDNVEGLAQEVIVIDGAASPQTRALCARRGARWLERPWPDNYAVQKNAALAAARGDWVLFLDTDERIGDRLRARLHRLIAQPGVDAYRIPMYWVVDSEPLRHLLTRKHYPCRVPRLFRRTPRLFFDERFAVHETVPKAVRGRTRKLRALHLFHLAFVLNDEAALAAKAAHYAEIAPASAATTARYYGWRDRPHGIRPCGEGYRR